MKVATAISVQFELELANLPEGHTAQDAMNDVLDRALNGLKQELAVAGLGHSFVRRETIKVEMAVPRIMALVKTSDG